MRQKFFIANCKVPAMYGLRESRYLCQRVWFILTCSRIVHFWHTYPGGSIKLPLASHPHLGIYSHRHILPCRLDYCKEIVSMFEPLRFNEKLKAKPGTAHLQHTKTPATTQAIAASGIKTAHAHTHAAAPANAAQP